MGSARDRVEFTSSKFLAGARGCGRAIGAVLLLAASARAQGSNPGRTNVQAMVDLAEPGSIVLVPSGTHAELVLTKPLVLLGATPRPTLGHVVLAGPGAGSLTLANLRLASPTGGSALIEGRGFPEIHVSDCELVGTLRVAGARWLEVSRSTLSQSGTVGPFIEARGATTSLMDVVITPFPPPLQNIGPDVLTARLCLVHASIPGSVQAKAVRSFANDLELGGQPHPGGTLDLTWTTPAPSVVVLASTGMRHPSEKSSGYWFLHEDARIIAVEPSPGGMQFPIPVDVRLLGHRLAFQLYDWFPPQSLSRPVATVIH